MTGLAAGLVALVLAAPNSGVPDGGSLQALATDVAAKVVTHVPEGSVALHVEGTPAELRRGFATLLHSALAEQGHPAFPLAATGSAEAEVEARERGARTLVRLTVGVVDGEVRARGDVLGTWVNFWSGRMPTRAASPAAVVAHAVPADAAVLLLASATPGAPVAPLTPVDPAPRVGGTLRVVHLPTSSERSPALMDTPLEATLASLTTRPLCRVALDGKAQLTLAQSFARSVPTTLRVTLVPGLVTASGKPLTASAVASALQEARKAPSPYRALLAPLRGAPRALSADTLELPLTHAYPDLEAALCHPALAVAFGRTSVGPFSPTRGAQSVSAVLTFPAGRPYLERILPAPAAERGVLRQLSLRQAELGLGVGGDGALKAQAALQLTVLTLPPSLSAPGLRAAVERAVDRADLTRYFVRGPAVPVHELLPPSLLTPSTRPVSARPAATPPREVPLLYDATLEDHRAVAERLQVKLKDLGWRVRLKGLPRAELRRAWDAGEDALMLHSLLLPPVPGPALAVVLETAHATALRDEVLTSLSQLEDPALRSARARERALALRERVPLVPLYAQALAIRAAPRLRGLAFDAQGLLVLDDAHLTSD